jgi:hypothetical protein
MGVYKMTKYIDPVEKAYNEGRTSLHAEEAVGLHGKVDVPDWVAMMKDKVKRYFASVKTQVGNDSANQPASEDDFRRLRQRNLANHQGM